jgi:hypothetical protein
MTESIYHRGPRWKVGNPTHPGHDDKEYHQETDAIEAARTLSSADFQLAIAVWDMETCDIAHLFIAKQQFKRA